MRNFIFTVSILLTATTLNAQVTSCSVDFLVTPLNWEEDVFQFGMDMVVDGCPHQAVAPWDTRPTFHPLNMDSGDTQYIIKAFQNDEVVDEYVITAIETGDGCLIEFTPDKVIGNKTKLSINPSGEFHWIYDR